MKNEDLKELLKDFIELESMRELKVPMAGLQQYKDALEQLWFHEENYSTNGWEVYFVLDFVRKKEQGEWYPETFNTLRLTGSLWYGEFKLEKR